MAHNSAKRHACTPDRVYQCRQLNYHSYDDDYYFIIIIINNIIFLQLAQCSHHTRHKQLPLVIQIPGVKNNENKNW